MSTNISITYRQVRDYNIPNLTLSPEETNVKLDKWGMLHKNYLQKHKPIVFAILLAQGKLWQYLADIDIQAQKMFETLVEQMKQKENITEQLKTENQMEWLQEISNISARAMELVLNDITYG